MATDKKEARLVPNKDKARTSLQKRPRKINLKRAVVGIGHFFKDVVSEMKKVSWASRKEFISYSVAVIVFVAVFGLIIFAMDYALQYIPNYISTLGS
jgi:preprotein translocase subunit SecE